MRGFRPVAMLPTIYRIYPKTLQHLAGDTLQTKTGPQFGHVPGRQAHEVVWMLRRLVEQATKWQIPIFVMDCDVAAAFDHVAPRDYQSNNEYESAADLDCRLDQRTQKFGDCGAVGRHCDTWHPPCKICATRRSMRSGPVWRGILKTDQQENSWKRAKE